MRGYGSFCPVAKAAEILAERWTLLVLRDMLQGSRHFNDLRRGVPQMSQTLLSNRLRTLEEVGLVSRKCDRTGRWEYAPTQSATELVPIIQAIGHWGQKWVRSQLVRDELDPGALMWFMHRHFDLKLVPSSGLVLYVEISDVTRLRCWWFVVYGETVDLCWDDPGHPVDISLYSNLLTLTQIFIGDLSLSRARARPSRDRWAEAPGGKHDGLVSSQPFRRRQPLSGHCIVTPGTRFGRGPSSAETGLERGTCVRSESSDEQTHGEIPC